MVAITTPTIAQPRRRPPVRRPAPALELAGRPARHHRFVGGARAVALVLAALVVAGAALYLVRAEPAPVAGGVPVLDTTRTVAEGDTMWSIANEVAPAGEAAAYVERLVAANGTARPSPGDVVVLPVP